MHVTCVGLQSRLRVSQRSLCPRGLVVVIPNTAVSLPQNLVLVYFSLCNRKIALARVIGNRRTKQLIAKQTLFFSLGDASGVSSILLRQAVASTGVAAGVSSRVRGGLKFSFFSTTQLQCCRRLSLFLGRFSNLLVSALGFAPNFLEQYVI